MAVRDHGAERGTAEDSQDLDVEAGHAEAKKDGYPFTNFVSNLFMLL